MHAEFYSASTGSNSEASRGSLALGTHDDRQHGSSVMTVQIRDAQISDIPHLTYVCMGSLGGCL